MWIVPLAVLILQFVVAQEEHIDKEFLWARWEKRSIECTNSTRGIDCKLNAFNSAVPRDPLKYKCRVEPMPKQEFNVLAKAATRLACPIGCEPDADLSVLTKVPANNTLCQKYYTYGKYRDTKENEWYLWVTEPCAPQSLTTHCRFKDVTLKGARKVQKTQ